MDRVTNTGNVQREGGEEGKGKGGEGREGGEGFLKLGGGGVIRLRHRPHVHNGSGNRNLG